MAKRGRKPKSQNLGPFASVTAAGAPVEPGIIAEDADAHAMWIATVALLEDRRILSPADQGVLAAYCSAWSTFCRCRRLLAPKADPTTGEVRDPFLVINTVTGSVKASPLIGSLSGAERSLASFASALGLTPVDRERAAAIVDQDQIDPLDEFLAGG
jgi:P27 family predicted phage terminase small subunit